MQVKPKQVETVLRHLREGTFLLSEAADAFLQDIALAATVSEDEVLQLSALLPDNLRAKLVEKLKTLASKDFYYPVFFLGGPSLMGKRDNLLCALNALTVKLSDPRKVTDDQTAFAEMMVKTLKTISRVVVTDSQNEPYIERLRLKRLPDGGSEVLHIFYHSDTDPFHDHPWHFESTIVYGSYIEHTPDKEPRIFVPGDVNKKRAEEPHRLELVDGPVITLMRRSKWFRKWCFHTDEGTVESLEWLRRQGIKPHG